MTFIDPFQSFIMKKIIRKLTLLGCLTFLINPGFSQVSIKVDNKSHRDIRVKVTWTSASGGSRKVETPILGHAKSYTLEIDEYAKNIKGTAQYKDGLDILNGMPWKNMSCPTLTGNGVLTYTGGPTAVPYPGYAKEKGGAVSSAQSVDIQNPNTGDFGIHTAVKKGTNSEVKEILRASDSKLNAKNKKGNTPLHEAMYKADTEIVETLIGAGANVSATNNQGKTPLAIAVDKNNAKLVKILQENGAKPGQNASLLKKAVQKGNTDIVAIFLDDGGNPEIALEEAMKRNKKQIYEQIIAQPDFQLSNAILEKAYNNGHKSFAMNMLSDPNINMDSVMDFAIAKKDKKMVTKALEHEGDAQKALEFAVVNNDMSLIEIAATMDGVQLDEPMKKAARNKNLKMVKALVDNGAAAEEGMPIALTNNDYNMVKYFLEYNVSAENYFLDAVKTKNDKIVKEMLMTETVVTLDTPLEYALDQNQYKIAQLIVEKGGHTEGVLIKAVNDKQSSLLRAVIEQAIVSDAEMKTGLNTSVEQNNTNFANMILEQYNGSIDDSMVKKAADHGNVEMISALVNKGGAPDAAMPLAIEKNETSLVKLLLASNADATKENYIVSAAKHNNLEIVKELVMHQASPDPAMPVAIEANNTSMTLFLLDNNADATKEAYITSAASKQNMDIVKALISNSANPDPALPIAVNANNTSMALYLMDEGANANQEAFLVTAARNKNQELVTAFLERGIRPDAALPVAIETDHTQIVRQLLEAGADVSNPSIIATAASKANAVIIQNLLQQGAQPDHGMGNAVSRGDAKVVKLFVEAGADGSKSEFIQGSSKAGNVAVTKVLLEAGADPNEGMENAFKANNTSLAKLLIQSDASVDDPRLMATAAANGNNELVSLLLKKGADANHGIEWAVKNNHTTTVLILLNAGADATSSRVMITAANHKNATVVEALIKGGGNANAAVEPALKNGSAEVLKQARLGGADLSNPAYLSGAVKANNLPITQELLAGGADPNQGSGATNLTLLHQTINSNNFEMMKLLVEQKADVNAAMTDGTTPLMLMVVKGKKYVEQARFLIQAGANVNARKADKIVFSMAKSRKMKKLLKDNGASKK